MRYAEEIGHVVRAQAPLPGAGALARVIKDRLKRDFSAREMSRLTRAAIGQSAADVDGALRQALVIARHEGRDMNVEDALTAILPDPEDDSPARDHRIAVHECGHVIVGTYLALGRVNRLALTRQGGQAWLQMTTGERLLSELEAEMVYSLAGRTAERLVLGAPAAGADGDVHLYLANATLASVRIDACYGLIAEGLIWLDVPAEIYLRHPEHAARVRSRLEEAETRAMELLEPRRELLLEMAADLEEPGMMERAPLEAWCARIRAEGRSNSPNVIHGHSGGIEAQAANDPRI